MQTRPLVLLLCLSLPLIGAAKPAATPASSPAASPLRSIALPGAASDGSVFMDYLAYDRAHGQVWVPAGNSARVDVIGKDGALREVTGFKTAEVTRHDMKRVVGPSSATVGDGVVYVGNRGDSSVCAVDAVSLKVGSCAKLDSSPDGLAYVAATKEVWVTTPRDKSIRVLDAAAMKEVAKITLTGEPEGFAVDGARATFFTNLEDADKTLAIDLKSRKVRSTWEPHCGEDGPKGLALDGASDVLFVACPDHVIALDAGHDGKLLGSIPVGEGIDNIDYLEARHELYVAAAKAATLAGIALESGPTLRKAWSVPTAAGARNAVASEDGTAYVACSREGKILVVPHP